MENSGTNNLKSRAIEICQELIRIPSVNFGEGKGDEIAIAQYVSDFLKKIGLEPEIIKTGETRANVVAKLEGTEPNLPGLIVHGHIDVWRARRGNSLPRSGFSNLSLDDRVHGREGCTRAHP